MKALFSGVIFYIKETAVYSCYLCYFLCANFPTRKTHAPPIFPPQILHRIRPHILKQYQAGNMWAGMPYITKRQQSYISLLPNSYCNLSAFLSAHSKIASNASCRQKVGSIVSSPSVFPLSSTFQTINVVI